MDEEPGYSKYDYHNKDADNSRSGHSQETMHTSYGGMEIDILRDRKGEFEPQIVKKVSAKYSCGFSSLLDSSIIVNEI